MTQTGHVEMWKALGLDLQAHDGLLQALGKMVQETFLSQKHRPEGMGYFDFVMSEIHGLRIRELVDARAAGRPVIGTFCLYVPEEIILAANGVAVGLCAGADFGTETVERLLPRTTCALIKSFFGFKLGGVCPYVEACDFVVGETTCDGKKKAYEIFDEYKPTFVMEVPHMRSDAARTLWRSEVARLLEKVEQTAKRPITHADLQRGVQVVNAKRRALHRLAALRGARPSPISGLDALLINQISFYDDPVRFTEKLNALCDELDGRVKRGEGVAPIATPRVLVSGCPMAAPNWKLHSLIERSGGIVVGEESCVGERGTRNLVREDGKSLEEVLDLIAARYIEIDCACFTPNEQRLDHVVQMKKAYQAAGVVHYGLHFCTPYAIEAMRVERAMSREEIPFLKIETDYSMEDLPQLETRVQAFLEMLRA